MLAASMSELAIKPAAECRFDEVSLGEVMLRLDPGEGRVHTTRTFRAWEGGGEYNVARGLRRCFGLRTAIVTALCDNPVGRLVEDLMLQGGVDLSLLRWVPYDGVGRAARNGLNFTERGFGPRGGVGCSDRGAHRRLADAPRRRRLARAVRRRRRPLVPHRRHLLRPVGGDAGRGARRDGGGAPARHARLVRPQLPRLALARGRRPGARARGQPLADAASSTSCSATRRTSPPRSASTRRASTRATARCRPPASAR